MTDDRVPVKIPQAGVAVTEGTIVDWLAADGDQVTAGQVLYRLETDKVEIDVECPASGVLHILGQPGETFPVGHDVGYVAGT